MDIQEYLIAKLVETIIHTLCQWLRDPLGSLLEEYARDINTPAAYHHMLEAYTQQGPIHDGHRVVMSQFTRELCRAHPHCAPQFLQYHRDWLERHP